MIDYGTISIIIKANEEEINNDEMEIKLSNKYHEIIEALEAWIKVKRQHFPCFNFEIEEE